MGFFSSDPMTYIVRLIVIFAILPIHECAHAYVSYKLGDPTAKRLGRLTINPLVHIDIIGAISLLIAGIGWAKPVPINPSYYRDKKWGMALSALAGPLANLLMAIVLLAIAKVFLCFYYIGGLASGILSTMYTIFQLMASISLSLAVFNLLPIPPLDGSRILLVVLPTKLYFQIMKYEQYIMIALFALLFVGVLDGPLGFLTNAVYSFADWATSFVPLLFGLR